MRLNTQKTLLVICIASAVGTGAAFCGQSGPHGDPGTQLERLTERLDLTTEQQAQIKIILEEERTAAEQLRAQVRQRIQGILTDAQRAAEDARQQKRLDRHVDRLTKRLGLSLEQVTQVRAILAERLTNPTLGRTELQRRIAAVLTPEQQKQFASMQSRDDRRGDHRGKKGDGPRGDDPPKGSPGGRPHDGHRDDPGDGPGDGPADGPGDDNGRDGR